MDGGWFAGGSGGCTGGKPTAGARAPGRRASSASRVPGISRVLCSAGPVQAPGIGGDASAAVLLASDDRGACPAQLYPLPVRAGASHVPLAGNQGKAVARHDEQQHAK